jgi:type VI secretion system protein ImpL
MLDRVRSYFESELYYWVFGLIALGLAALTMWFWPAIRVLFTSKWTWIGLGVILAFGAFAFVWWGLPRFREWRFARRTGSPYLAAGQRSPEELTAKFNRAVRALKRLPQLSGVRDPLYALPWYLLLGPPRSGKTALVKHAELFTSLTAEEPGGPSRNCDWWISNSQLVLDTAGRYGMPGETVQDRAEWFRLLWMIARQRRLEPLDGIIVVLPVDEIASESEEKLRTLADKLRERIEEALEQLKQDLPLYLVLTKCDSIEGFSEFMSLLPERSWAEALGHTVEHQDGGQRNEQPKALAAALTTIYERLLLFRNAILESRGDELMRQPVFTFPEDFRALEAPLVLMAEPLLGEDVRYHTPLLRGVFLTSAELSGSRFSALRKQLQVAESAPEPAKKPEATQLRDLFTMILPRDRGLATYSRREKARATSMGTDSRTGDGRSAQYAVGSPGNR